MGILVLARTPECVASLWDLARVLTEGLYPLIGYYADGFRIIEVRVDSNSTDRPVSDELSRSVVSIGKVIRCGRPNGQPPRTVRTPARTKNRT